MTTEEQRRTVKALAGYGVRQEEICAILGLRSPKTLRKRFRRELELGVVEARAKVKQTAFQLAASGRDPKATMFWLNGRAGWGRKDPDSEYVKEIFVIRNFEFSSANQKNPSREDSSNRGGIIFENARTEKK